MIIFSYLRKLNHVFRTSLFFGGIFCVQGGDLGRYVQRKLSGVKIFAEPFLSVKENLKTGVSICEQWVAACEHLTGQVISVTAESSALNFFSEYQTERTVSVAVGEILEMTFLSVAGVEATRSSPLEGRQALPSNTPVPGKKIR